mmetsp:Transcript_22714/g.38075  ORF Transcript_22714/g.38075 Transcript_22714/m.38075 type:complete len:108 (-) Transcript_22714:132-455(-)
MITYGAVHKSSRLHSIKAFRLLHALLFVLDFHLILTGERPHTNGMTKNQKEPANEAHPHPNRQLQSIKTQFVALALYRTEVDEYQGECNNSHFDWSRRFWVGACQLV